MSLTVTYLSGSIATLLSTELNSLANNALAIGSAYAAGGNYLLAEIEIFINTFGTAPSANTGCSIWFLRAIDGSNYEDGGSSTTPSRIPDLIIPVEAQNSATQRITRRCVIPPGTWKPLLKNDGTGQTLPASGNTLKILPLTVQSS